MADRVTVSMTADGVADVRLNRPEKINALDPAMFAAIVAAGEALKSDPSVRAVVLSGEGRGFCAGLDFTSFQAMAGGGGPDGVQDAAGEALEAGVGSASEQPTPERSGFSAKRTEGTARITHLGQQAAYVWQELEVPVIAAVHGAALGGGAQIALGADIRIVAPDVKLSILEIRWGLVPDMTGTAMLTRLVGLDVAKELALTGRMVDGAEAVRIGLATRVSDTPLEDALALATEIAGKSPKAVRGVKRLLNASPGRELANQFADERRTIGALIGSPDQVEAVTAFFEKRTPVFEG